MFVSDSNQEETLKGIYVRREQKNKGGKESV